MDEPREGRDSKEYLVSAKQLQGNLSFIYYLLFVKY